MGDRHWYMVMMMMAFCLTACVSTVNRCKPKYHSHKAVQTDQNGKRCWDVVKIRSCGGYCMSYERPHWEFPYKESHHPVCVHNERKHKFIKLQHCDPGVEPNTEDYHYVEAASCKCKICSSKDTSCEWLPPDSNLLNELISPEFSAKETQLDEDLDYHY